MTFLRERSLAAAMSWGAILAALTALLSVLHGLTPTGVASSWATILGLLIALAAPVQRPGRMSWEGSEFDTIRHRGGRQSSVLLVIAMVLVVTGLIALSAPTSWDAMTYHLARVGHWVQNASVAHYPTNIDRQLYQPPWAEFALLHLQLLSGGDRWANLLQWFAMAGSIMAVTLIAAELGADARTQGLAGLFAATLPMGILQGSSAQNDWVATLWLACLAWLVVRNSRGEIGWVYLLLTGAALGLAVLTKGTMYILALPFVVWLGVSELRAHPRGRATMRLAAVAGVALALNVGHYARNAAVFGSPLGPETHVVNEALGPGVLASNVVRNVALHVGTPSPRVNERIEGAIEWMHERVGLDANDPATTWAGTEFIVPFTFHEDSAGNPLHLVLLAAALVLLARHWRREPRRLLVFSACLVGAFVLFALVLKWQPWHSRLHLPLFALAAPVVACVLVRWTPPPAVRVGAVVLVVAAVPWLLLNSARPLIGPRSVLTVDRTSQYFSVRPDLEEPYRRTAAFLEGTGCRDVGLYIGGNDWEYPLWVLLGGVDAEVRLRHVGVRNASRRLDRSTTPPCAVVATEARAPDGIPFGALQPAASFGPLTVYVREGLQ